MEDAFIVDFAAAALKLVCQIIILAKRLCSSQSPILLDESRNKRLRYKKEIQCCHDLKVLRVCAYLRISHTRCVLSCALFSRCRHETLPTL